MGDATLQWGWYCIQDTFLGCIASHSFALIKGSDGPWFDCYGGHEGPKRTWGSKRSGSRKLAVTIACFDPKDERGYREADFDRKSGGALGLGDCSGIVYGVSGVCHQMANRVLWETGLTVTSAPGWPISYTAYGIFGNPVGQPAWYWAAYLAACKAKAACEATAPQYSELIQRMVDNEGEFEGDAEKLHENRLRLLAEDRLGPEYSPANLAKLARVHLQFVERKARHDEEYLSKSIEPREHAAELNALHGISLQRMNEILGGHDYETLFGCPDGHQPILINPEIADALSGH